MPFNNSCTTAATGLREWSSPLQVWWRDHLQSNQELHGILLDFLWDLLACMLDYVSLETFFVLQKCRMVPNLTWKLYEECVLSCPEGGGTYLDLGRATVTKQMQPENTHTHLPTWSLRNLTKAFRCLQWPWALVSAAGVVTGPPPIKWSMELLHRQMNPKNRNKRII